MIIIFPNRSGCSSLSIFFAQNFFISGNHFSLDLV